MTVPKRIPWQCFFSEEVLEIGRRRLHEQRVLSCAYDPAEQLVSGIVTMRKAYSVSVSLLDSMKPGSAQVLMVENFYFDCQCSQWAPCWHAAALMHKYVAEADFSDPKPAAVAIGRELVKSGMFDSEWDEDDDDNDEDDEDEDDEDEDEDAAGQTAKVIQFPHSGRPAVTPNQGEPLPTIAVARMYRDDNGSAWALDQWFNHTLMPAKPVADPEHCLSYHLRRNQRDPSCWTVEVVRARRLKSGALGVQKRYRSIEAAREAESRTATAEECHLLGWLGGLRHPGQSYVDHPQMSTESGVTTEMFARLLATGRCFVEDFAHPLAAGPALKQEPIWGESEPGKWRLTVRQHQGSVNEREVTVLPLSPPWYIVDGVAGPIDSVVLSAMSGLVRMPPIPTTLLPAAIARLRERVPAMPSPATTITVGAPSLMVTGHLITWKPTVSPLSDVRRRIPVELVLFGVQYGTVLSDPIGVGPVTGADGQPILRDRQREAELAHQLRQMGLVPVSELEERATKLGWSSLLNKQLPMRCWVCKATVLNSNLIDPIILPPAILSVLAASGWTVAGSEVLPEALTAATIEAHFRESTEPLEAGGNDWFQLDLGVRFGDERIDLTPIIATLILDPAAVGRLPQVTLEGRVWVCVGVPDGRVIRVPLDLLQRLVAHLTALFDAPPQAGGWRTDPWQALSLDGIAGLEAINGPRLTDLAKRLAALVADDEMEPPATLLATLRPYQKRGLAWLQRLRAAGTGGVLADDMGLGKTVQAIAHLCTEHAAGRLSQPALVVGPASLVGTWRRELARFAPHFTVVILHGGARARTSTSILEGRPQVVITTYATLMRDAEEVAKIEWSVLIADEAQAIGNPAIKSGQAVRRLKVGQRLALTGTPMSNHLGELHTLMSWLVPGLLGSPARFDKAFRRPIEKGGDQVRAGILRRRIAPFMLRRTKELVAPELPPRTETVVTVELEGGQRALYESVRLAMDERIRAVIAAKGLAKSHIDVFEALTKLRLCCCDPRLVKSAGKKTVTEAGSAKLDWLRTSLPELIEEGRRILVFSQFTSWLDLIERDALTPAGLSWLRLDGSTVDRDTPVQRFQRGEVPIFLLSLKAGGTGLTLTAADTVIITDPWWNPAAEDQAADRAHRIGQDKPVFVWRLVAEGTVEERILALQARKRALMSAMLDDQGQSVPAFTEADLAALLAPLPD